MAEHGHPAATASGSASIHCGRRRARGSALGHLHRLLSWLVLTADDFPQSSELHPDKALMFWLALSACALGLASLWAASTRRPWMALAAVGIEALVTFATRSTTRSGGSSPRCAHSRWKSRWDLLPAPIDPDQGRAEATPVSF